MQLQDAQTHQTHQMAGMRGIQLAAMQNLELQVDHHKEQTSSMNALPHRFGGAGCVTRGGVSTVQLS
jgi:hypothetical protein